VDTKAHDGTVFQAAGPATLVKSAVVPGRCAFRPHDDLLLQSVQGERMILINDERLPLTSTEICSATFARRSLFIRR